MFTTLLKAVNPSEYKTALQPSLVSEASRIYNAGLELLVGVDAGAIPITAILLLALRVLVFCTSNEKKSALTHFKQLGPSVR